MNDIWMTYPRLRPALIAAVLALVLTGCAGRTPEAPPPLDPEAVEEAVARGDGLDPASYAGEFTIKAPTEIPAKDTVLPVVLYAGLSPDGATRLKIRSVVDLRRVQMQLPELLTGVIVDNCKQRFALDFTAADAAGDSLRAWGTVDAQFFRCGGADDDLAARGRRYLSARIGAYAEAAIEVEDECVVVRLRDIQLDPHGFWGGIANLFGLTSIARSAILKEGTKILDANPICPELPPELAPLEPQYDGGGPREVGAGGMSAELTGTVDSSADTLIRLLALIQEAGVLEAVE